MSFKLIRLKRALYGLVSFIVNHLPLLLVILLLISLSFLAFKAKDLITATGLKTKETLNFFKDPQTIFKNTNQRTNFLILGIRGFGDQGDDLTDTMLMVSFHYPTNQLSLVSIPRDLWVNSLKTKINAVYHYGNFRSEENGGVKLTQAAILETLGLPIHYTLVVDFNLFKNLIDLVGGIDVNVAHSFTDNQFPIPGKETALPISSRYETISFNMGPNHFDGETALKFVRSRYAQGDEGTDIARSARQQLVFAALKEKILKPEFFLDKNKVDQIFKVLNQNTKTDLTPDFYPSLARLGLSAYKSKLNVIDLSYEPDSQGIAILENPPIRNYQNQWVLIARDNNWKALQQYLLNRLEGKQ